MASHAAFRRSVRTSGPVPRTQGEAKRHPLSLATSHWSGWRLVLRHPPQRHDPDAASAQILAKWRARASVHPQQLKYSELFSWVVSTQTLDHYCASRSSTSAAYRRRRDRPSCASLRNMRSICCSFRSCTSRNVRLHPCPYQATKRVVLADLQDPCPATSDLRSCPRPRRNATLAQAASAKAHPTLRREEQASSTLARASTPGCMHLSSFHTSVDRRSSLHHRDPCCWHRRWP